MMFGGSQTRAFRELKGLLAFVVGIAVGLFLTSGPSSAPPPSSTSVSSMGGCFDAHRRPVGRPPPPLSWIGTDNQSAAEEGDWAQPQPKLDPRRSLVLVGVMTAQKYLATRAMAVHRTWAKALSASSGQVLFFVGGDAGAPPAGLPGVIRLQGVEDAVYPPQRKSFHMLKWMHDHFADRFDWFMRTDDDVYVRGDRLERLLRSVDAVARPLLFVGQAGTGTKEEMGLLDLPPSHNFCMGGPGVVLSRETLKRVGPNVERCLKAMTTTHEDVELGRCVRRFAGIPCTWSYEMQNIFYHNGSGSDAFTGSLNQKEVDRAITLHPIKHHHHLYRVHNHVQALKMHDLRQRTLLFHRDASAMATALSNGPSANHSSSMAFFRGSWMALREEPLGKAPCLNKAFPEVDSDVLVWDFFSGGSQRQRTFFSAESANPKRRMDSALKEALEEAVVQQIMEMINRFSKQRGRVIDFKELLYGYGPHVDPLHGADYILDLLLVYKKYRGKKMTLPVRKHVYLQQAFTKLQVGPFTPSSSSSFSSEEVHVVLPLSGRMDTFRRFLRRFEDIAEREGDKGLSMTVVHASTLPSEKGSMKELLQELRHRRPGLRVELLEVEEATEGFSRAMLLKVGSDPCPPEQLLAFVDVDMALDRNFLQRVRWNTIRGRQVYFPMVFSQFDPKTVDDKLGTSRSTTTEDLLVDDRRGYWRHFGFGIVGIYKEDLISVGGLDASIHGWGKEDVDLYDKVVSRAKKDLVVFRAPDLGLVHVFHPVACDPNSAMNSEQMDMCLGSKANSYASVNAMAKRIAQEPNILQSALGRRKISYEGT